MNEKKCDVCGTPLVLNKDMTYLVKGRNLLTGRDVVCDAVDCIKCGCQNVLKERKEFAYGREES